MAPKKKKKKEKKDGEAEEVDIDNNPAVLHYELGEARRKEEYFRDNFVRQRNENNDQRSKLDQREKEHFELINYLRQENERKDRVIANLNESLKEQRHLLEKDHETVTNHFKARMEEAAEVANRQKNELRRQIDSLKEKLEVHEKFTHDKDILETEVRRLRVEIEEQTNQHKDALTNWEQKFFDEKRRVQDEMHKIVSDIRTQSKEDAIAKLGERTKVIMHEHAQKVDELRFQAEATEEMRIQRDDLENEKKILMRDKSLHESTFMELAREGAFSKKQIRTLTNKVRLLEDSLKEVTRQNSQERTRVMSDLQQQVDLTNEEADQLRQQLRVKSKEMKHIRRLSQMILEQRSEVEQFFVEALEQVKLERAKQRDDEKRRQRAEQAKSLREHAIGSRPDSELASERDWGDDKIHLKDLNIEDRERVLRLLFAKINAAHKGNKPQPPPVIDMNDREPIPPDYPNDHRSNVYLTQPPEETSHGSLPTINPRSR